MDVYTLHITLLNYYITQHQILYARISLPYTRIIHKSKYSVNTITMQPYG